MGKFITGPKMPGSFLSASLALTVNKRLNKISCEVEFTQELIALVIDSLVDELKDIAGTIILCEYDLWMLLEDRLALDEMDELIENGETNDDKYP